MPQVHGACRDAVAYAEWLLKLELNSVTDNPLIFIDENDPEKIEVISGGNFHGEPLAMAFDYLAIALTELGNISERRTMRLTDENSNAHTLPAFLTEHGGLNSGFMIVQYTAAALCTENKILAHPACVDTIPTSANVEDHVSMGATGALKLRQVADNLANILAIELLCAAQGIDFRKRRGYEKSRLGKRTKPVYEAIRNHVPFIEHDEYLKDYIDNVRGIVDRFENE
jgi:histidine ammonia-lyase